MLFELRQRLMMPKGIGFNGVQCFVIGRAEKLDEDTKYHVRFIDDDGNAGVLVFTEQRLVTAQKPTSDLKPLIVGAKKKRSRKRKPKSTSRR